MRGPVMSVEGHKDKPPQTKRACFECNPQSSNARAHNVHNYHGTIVGQGLCLDHSEHRVFHGNGFRHEPPPSNRAFKRSRVRLVKFYFNVAPVDSFQGFVNDWDSPCSGFERVRNAEDVSYANPTGGRTLENCEGKRNRRSLGELVL